MADTLLAARKEMMAGRFASALAILTDAQRVGPTGQNRSAQPPTQEKNGGDAEEREVQLIELLHATGHPNEAKIKARRFLRDAPCWARTSL